MARTFRIFPGIGIARLGSADDHFVGPEVPFQGPIEADGTPVARFRDALGNARGQAARFRIFEFDDDLPSDPGREVEVGRDGIEEIEWRVHLANKKATWYGFAGLVGEEGAHQYSRYGIPRRNGVDGSDPGWRDYLIDPGPRRVRGPGRRADFDGPYFPVIEPRPMTTLGRILTDARSRLLVCAGEGISGHTDRWRGLALDAFNNEEWFDDVADGPVEATVTLADGTEVAADPAWVLATPPNFVPHLDSVVTLYDLLYDLAIEHFGLEPAIRSRNSGYRPNFATEIRPLLERATNVFRFVWSLTVTWHDWLLDELGDPTRAHALREVLFERLRKPGQQNVFRNQNFELMPRLAGDNIGITDRISPDLPHHDFVTVTATQAFLMERWAKGSFRNEPPAGGLTPRGLDRASLEACVGAAFCPGIEVGWIIRNPAIHRGPFRLRGKPITGEPLSFDDDPAGLEPGDLGKRMAIPWQTDFHACETDRVGSAITAWWPAQRPIDVLPSADAPGPKKWVRDAPGAWDFIERWHRDLRFVVRGRDADGEELLHEEES
ncbi:MAG: LodA/GoxA family CTQ-dependent oxidase [Thermoanaerobaculia bacterium]|nr:LodA/GoxA family CTQ-dependent oxidase [Thermoanaerobaculia bacterium]